MAKHWRSAGSPPLGVLAQAPGTLLPSLTFTLWNIQCLLGSSSLKVGGDAFCHHEWWFLLAWQCPFWMLQILHPPLSWCWVVSEMLGAISHFGSRCVLIPSCPYSLLPLVSSAVIKGGICLQHKAATYSFRLFSSITDHCILAPWFQLKLQEMFYFYCNQELFLKKDALCCLSS